MAVSINTGGTYTVVRVTDAETITGWGIVKVEGSGGTPSAFPSVGSIDLVKEGTDAVASIANKQRVKLFFADSGGYDFTSGGSGTGGTKVPSGIAYMWAVFLGAGSALLKANGGMQLTLGDGSNTSYWNIAGSDTYSGGFIKWAVLTTVAPDENSGVDANLGDITEIGFVCDVGGTTTRFDNMVVDAIEVGSGLTLQGTTTSDKLFSESVVQDEATSIGLLSNVNGTIFSQGSVEFSGTAMTSDTEKFTFTDSLGGVYTYSFDITGTVTFRNSSVDGSGTIDYDFNSSSAVAFSMSGGSLGGAKTVVFATGQTIDGVVFASCGEIYTNGATISNCTIGSTTEATTGALVGNSSSEITSMSNMSFNNYTGKYALYIPASVTGTITLNGFQGDGSGTDVFWAGTTGTLTINKSNGTNFTTSATAGGTVNLVASVSIVVNVKDQGGSNISGALVYIDEDLNAVGEIINTTSDGIGNVATSYSGVDTSATVRVRKYGYKAFVGSIGLTADSSTNVILITDPQQT